MDRLTKMRGRRASLMARSASIALLSACAALANAEAKEYKAWLDIPAQSLEAALKEFGVETDSQVLFTKDLVTGRTSIAIKGVYTQREALAHLLQGTGLRIEQSAERVFLIRSVTAAAADLKAAQPAAADKASEKPKDDEEPQSSSEKKVEKVIVTGTNIRNGDSLSPIRSIDREEIRSRGYGTLEQTVASIPQNFKGSAAPDVNPLTGVGAASNNNAYASGINLRGLGTEATLVLVNGQRLAPTAFGTATDISTIPVSIIERIDVLTGGASAVYGSDAVAGVVNIITRQDFDGLETHARYGTIGGDSDTYNADILGGVNWTEGNLTLNYSLQKSEPLFASTRSFSSLPEPSSLIPDQRIDSVYASVQQAFGDRANVRAIALLSDREFESITYLPFASTLDFTSGTAKRRSAAADIEIAVTTDWFLNIDASGSHEHDQVAGVSPTYVGYPDGFNSSRDNRYGVWSIAPRLNGSLLELPGGDMRIAVGALYQEESLIGSLTVLGTVQPPGEFEATRVQRSAYAEVFLPLVGRDNEVSLVSRLDASAAIRYDSYSDVGTTVNPKFGLGYSPVDSVRFEGSYSTSYKAPTLLTLQESSNSYGYIIDQPNTAAPSGTTQTLLLLGNNGSLRPQTAETWNFGATWNPDFAAGVQIEANYFRIDYTDQLLDLSRFVPLFNVFDSADVLGGFLITSPTTAQVQTLLDEPTRQIFSLVGPFDASSVQAIADLRYQNVGRSVVDGIDANMQYATSTGDGVLTLSAEGTYTLKSTQRTTPGSGTVDLVNTLYNIPQFRGRVGADWSRGGFAINGSLNYNNAYRDKTSAACAGFADGCGVDAWTTVDLALSYEIQDQGWMRGLRFGLAIRNVFDEDPPFVRDANLGYDPTNADPYKRVISLDVTKTW